MGTTGEREKAVRIETVNKKNRYVRGFVTKLSSYKGHNINVKYIVDNMEYKSSAG